MKELSIDIETRSAVDIKKSGAYRYALDPSFRILLFAYKVDDLPTQIVDLAQGEELPVGIRVALADQTVIKHAYNAAFEWFCLTTAGYMTALGQWRCTMAHGSYCGYPAGLDALGQAIGLPPEQQKLKIGRALIKHFCTPSGSKLFEWNEPEQSPEKWPRPAQATFFPFPGLSRRMRQRIGLGSRNTASRTWRRSTRLGKGSSRTRCRRASGTSGGCARR